MIRKFLLADDDQDDADLFGEALEEIDPGIEFTFMRTCEELITKLRTEKLDPEVIFLDINMPGIKGWECLDTMKDQDLLKNIPVIIYSTSSPAIYGIKAIQSGAIAYYEKPPNFLQLQEFLTMIVTSSPGSLKKTLADISRSDVHSIFTEQMI